MEFEDSEQRYECENGAKKDSPLNRVCPSARIGITHEPMCGIYEQQRNRHYNDSGGGGDETDKGCAH